jgi:hypothetical protein
MVNFKISLTKGSQGEILVNGNYVSGSDPLYIERVVIEELDSQGNALGSSTDHVDMSIDPMPGAYLLCAKMPSGSNVKKVRATACYIEIDKTAKSGVVDL